MLKNRRIVQGFALTLLAEYGTINLFENELIPATDGFVEHHSGAGNFRCIADRLGAFAFQE